MLRVVLDTNILISACWSPGGLEDRLVSLALAGDVQPCISGATWAEYTEVLSRRKFDKRRPTIETMLARFEECALHVEPSQSIALAKDEDDNRFLECADAAGAQYLITGNLRDYPNECGITRVVNSREFLNLIGCIKVPAVPAPG